MKIFSHPKTQSGFISSSSRGFTLMEVMVSVTIFTIIVTVGIVALLTINDSYNKSQNDRQAIDSLTYTLESMSRRIRTARTWDPQVATEEFSFVDQEGIPVYYYWDIANEKIMAEIAGDVFDLTPSNVKISNASFPAGGLRFTVLPPAGGGSGTQSYVQINLGGVVSSSKQKSEFWFQTGVSKRTLDLAM